MQIFFRAIEKFRHQLSHTEALPQLVVLGLLSGFSAAVIIALFRYCVDVSLSFVLMDSYSFEQLPLWARFSLPIAGSLLILLVLQSSPISTRKVGVVHVLERLNNHHAILPFRNMLNQFLCAAIALISGHSVGREGPAIHLGAACSSLLGQKLKLPNNVLRLLVGCGTAAAISAAFNTPLAGIIFAMEVILLEYTLAGFLPIMVAAITADLVNRLFFSSYVEVSFSSHSIYSLAEVPFIALLGIIIGLISALFHYITQRCSHSKQYSLNSRIILAGLLTGSTACFVPEVMGLGFDTLTQALNGDYLLLPAITILTAKLLLTPTIIGLGIPGGLIGPCLVIGSLAGAILGILGNSFVDQPVSHVGLYAMIGMGAMMAAVINAPLAALTALLEFTGNPNIILPAMISILISSLTVRYIFGLPSIFVSTLNNQGISIKQSPVHQALSRAAVSSLMHTHFTHCQRKVDYATAQQLCKSFDSLLVQDHQSWAVLSSQHLSLWLLKQKNFSSDLDLFGCPHICLGAASAPITASLKEALDIMNEHNVDQLYIENQHQHICGLLAKSQLQNFYLQDSTI